MHIDEATSAFEERLGSVNARVSDRVSASEKSQSYNPTLFLLRFTESFNQSNATCLKVASKSENKHWNDKWYDLGVSEET